MYNNRRNAARGELGLTTQQEQLAIQQAMMREEQVRQAKLARKRELQEDDTYRLINNIATISDKYFLDPLLGFFLPGVGDLISSAFALPFIYFAMFRVKSLKLTLALLFNILLDLMIGAIPALGDLFDAFYRSNLKNFKLIVGYIEEDPKTRREIEQKATALFVLVALAVLLVWGVYSCMSHSHEEYMRTHPNAWKF